MRKQRVWLVMCEIWCPGGTPWGRGGGGGKRVAEAQGEGRGGTCVSFFHIPAKHYELLPRASGPVTRISRGVRRLARADPFLCPETGYGQAAQPDGGWKIRRLSDSHREGDRSRN